MSQSIQFDASGESQVFVASRDVRNSDHQNGTIMAGERVFFRQVEYGGGAEIALVGEDGQPTDGNQYATFDSVSDAEAFADHAGLMTPARLREASTFEVFKRDSAANIDAHESHGVYDTLDEARGCVEFDGLRDYEIWQGDRIVEESE